MYGVDLSRGFAPMVFCRQCQRKVEDCEHCVLPIKAKRVRVFDEKVATLAYEDEKRILEIAFKNGQVWQLFDVSDGIYKEIQNSTISSFLKFIGRRYVAAPVKHGIRAIAVPETEACPNCKTPMTQSNRTESSIDNFVRVFWLCPACKKSEWKTYGTGPVRERRARWH
jgi:uncharacterized protein with PIN domain